MSSTLTLRHIVDGACPDCAAKIIRLEVGSRHTNGKENEIATFACGAALHFSPNFNQVRMSKRCPMDPVSVTIKSIKDGLEVQLKRSVTTAIRKATAGLSKDDGHLHHTLTEALKKLRLGLHSSISMDIMRYL